MVGGDTLHFRVNSKVPRFRKASGSFYQHKHAARN